MSAWLEHNRIAVHLGILGLVIIVSSAVLLIGYDSSTDPPPELAEGEPSPQDFRANGNTREIPDPEKTAAAQDAAEAEVPAPFRTDGETTQQVLDQINFFYADLMSGALNEADLPDPATVPDVVDLSEAQAVATLEAAELTAVVSGFRETTDEAFVGQVFRQDPAANTLVEAGSSVNLIVFVLAGTTTTTLPPDTTTTTLIDVDESLRVPDEDQVAELSVAYGFLGQEVLNAFVQLHESDVDRVLAGEASVFSDMQETTIAWAIGELDAGIREEELAGVRTRYLSAEDRPPLPITGIPEDDVETTHDAMAALVAQTLQANERIDQVLWDEQRQAARANVPEQTTSYRLGDPIADEGDILTSVQVAAIVELELYEPEIILVAPEWALAVFAALCILVFGFLLYRIAPKDIERTRNVVLVGIIVGLAALTARIPGLVTDSGHPIGYVMPAVAIGMMAAILFEQRTALLFVLPMAGFTAIATTDITFTVYAAVAAAVPVGFVSAVSTRAQLRASVLGTAAVVAPVGSALEFLFFYGADDHSPLLAGAWAFGGAVIGGFLAQGLVSFLENAFGVTTAMSLLDLLDRNHPALQELEQKAPGTFNHSMLVGSLAGRAARSIGADPLLAQAAAWYHDLGKTEHPQYFVENQLGYNPHDELAPEESAAIIRRHVTDGLELAKKFRIPDDVANGIRMHHGTSLMRFFYHKALTQDPDVDPEAFRHRGEKPKRREMAIVMISDATEAAARSYAQQEQPTEVGLRKLVDDIVTEKLDDGQFDEASLTFGELTTIKNEIVAGLSAYYHARVEYPDFPEAETTSTATPTEVS